MQSYENVETFMQIESEMAIWLGQILLYIKHTQRIYFGKCDRIISLSLTLRPSRFFSN